MENKGVLFQAKKTSDRRRGKLLEQAQAMEGIAPRGSSIFEYGPQMYRGADSKAVIATNGNLSNIPGTAVVRLGDYLADRFLPCKIGLRGLYYEGTRRTLFIPKRTRGYRRLRARLKHQFRIEVRKQ